MCVCVPKQRVTIIEHHNRDYLGFTQEAGQVSLKGRVRNSKSKTFVREAYNVAVL